jgi:RNA:NAD 2'-phosphotransferase (TPT1/KptA family)
MSAEGWAYMSVVCERLNLPEHLIREGLEQDARGRKTRLASRECPETGEVQLRSIQGHSSDAGLPAASLEQLYPAVTDAGLAERGFVETTMIYHGTDVARVKSILQWGLLPGGGNESNRVACHWVAGELPRPFASDVRGFRSGSDCVIATTFQALTETGVIMCWGAEGVVLTSDVPPEAILAVFGREGRPARYCRTLAQRDRAGDPLAFPGSHLGL